MNIDYGELRRAANQSNERKKAIGQLSDQEFIVLATEKITWLSEKLRDPAKKLVSGIQSDIRVKPSRVTFIPIAHLPFDKILEHNIKVDVNNILESTTGTYTLIANGESSSEKQNRQDIVDSQTELIQAIRRLGLINDSLFPTMEKVAQQTSFGFEAGLLDYLRNHPNTQAIGAESKDGKVLGTALVMDKSLVNPLHQSKYQEIMDFFSTDARTRFALNYSSSRLQEGQELILIQGVLHRLGVEEWCKRYNIPYRVIIPNAVKKFI